MPAGMEQLVPLGVKRNTMTRVVPDSTWLKNWWLWTNGKLFLRQP